METGERPPGPRRAPWGSCGILRGCERSRARPWPAPRSRAPPGRAPTARHLPDARAAPREPLQAPLTAAAPFHSPPGPAVTRRSPRPSRAPRAGGGFQISAPRRVPAAPAARRTELSPQPRVPAAGEQPLSPAAPRPARPGVARAATAARKWRRGSRGPRAPLGPGDHPAPEGAPDLQAPRATRSPVASPAPVGLDRRRGPERLARSEPLSTDAARQARRGCHAGEGERPPAGAGGGEAARRRSHLEDERRRHARVSGPGLWRVHAPGATSRAGPRPYPGPGWGKSGRAFSTHGFAAGGGAVAAGGGGGPPRPPRSPRRGDWRGARPLLRAIRIYPQAVAQWPQIRRGRGRGQRRWLAQLASTP